MELSGNKGSFNYKCKGNNGVISSIIITGMEAVVLSIYLTNGVPCLGRFPINFKSELPPQRVGPRGNQRYFYHVVLGMAHGSKFGSVGLSRR